MSAPRTPDGGAAPRATSSALPGGFAGQMLAFGEELRREGVAVGTSALLDAFAALQVIDWTSQPDFRETLAATLAKSQEDRRVFELVFDRFFFRAVEAAAMREGVREEGGVAGADVRGARHRAAATPDRRGTAGR